MPQLHWRGTSPSATPAEVGVVWVNWGRDFVILLLLSDVVMNIRGRLFGTFTFIASTLLILEANHALVGNKKFFPSL
jgi:hypothetical protein